MYPLPFAIQRPWLLMRDLVVNRNQPNLARLRGIRSPERFLWAILPHAARTFSACITMLPASSAKAAAVGYLYCRILDTYEDLAPCPQQGRQMMREFAARFQWPTSTTDSQTLPPGPALTNSTPIDYRDQSHLLLVEKCELIDRVFLKLPAASQIAIVHLVRDMAGGMIWAKRVFENQNGVLHSPSQLRHYCNAVLGNPVAFAMRLMMGRELTADERATAMDVGEFVQLANVTRDMEKDLDRGIAYHPSLVQVANPSADVIRSARGQLFDLAMAQATAYRRMVEQISFRRISLSRASALLMLEFTDRYYRSCAKRIDRETWDGPKNSLRLMLRTFPAFLSKRSTLRRVNQIEHNLVNAGRAPLDSWD